MEEFQAAGPPPSGPRYPEISVRLSGRNGNAMVLVGAVRDALRRAHVSDAEIRQFTDDALSKDYDHVLQTCEAWVDVS